MDELLLIPFKTDNEKEPFTEWLLSVDSVIRNRIIARLTRIQTGNFGDCKLLEEGVFELRFFFGSGYRVYFGKDEETNTIIILLCGGNKNTQNKDIKKANQYWRQYNERKTKKS